VSPSENAGGIKETRVSRARPTGLTADEAYDKNLFGAIEDRPLMVTDLLRPPCASQSPVAMDEMFELFDNELLITDNAFHHIANRNYTN